MRFVFLKIAFLLVVVIGAVMSAEQWKVMETGRRSSGALTSPSGKDMGEYVQGDRAAPDTEITLVFAVKQKDISATAAAIADPSSPLYGKHMTRDQIDEMTAIPESEEAVKSYLVKNGIQPQHMTRSYIQAEAPVRAWEQALNTQFYTYSNSVTGSSMVRTHEYSLPAPMFNHVRAVLNTVQLPVAMHGGPRQAAQEQRQTVAGHQQAK